MTHLHELKEGEEMAEHEEVPESDPRFKIAMAAVQEGFPYLDEKNRKHLASIYASSLTS